MAKRKGARTSLPEVDEEKKKAKTDTTPDKPKEEKPRAPAVKTPEVVASNPDDLDYIQIIVTGPKGCGKSCLVLSYMGQLFPPSGGEFLSKQYLRILENEQPVMIWDLDSRKQFHRYRQQSYQEADVALLCFDLRKPENSTEGNEKEDIEKLLRPWYSELDNFKAAKIFLVGLKGDLKGNSVGGFFSDVGIKYARSRFDRIVSYTEVSAHGNKDGVNELFTMAINSINNQPKPKRLFTKGGFEIIRASRIR